MKQTLLLILLSIGCAANPPSTNASTDMAILTLMPADQTSATSNNATPIAVQPTEIHVFLDNIDAGKYESATNQILTSKNYLIDLYVANGKPYLYSDTFAQIYYTSYNCSGQAYVIDTTWASQIVSNFYFYKSNPVQHDIYVIDYMNNPLYVTINSYMDNGVCTQVTWTHSFRYLSPVNQTTAGIDVTNYSNIEFRNVTIQ